MGSSKRSRDKTSSNKKFNQSDSTKNFQDVLTKLDGLRTNTKAEHSKVQHSSSHKQYQVAAVVLIIVIGMAGLVFLYNPNPNISSPKKKDSIIASLGDFQEDTSVSSQPLFIDNEASVVYVGAQYCPNCAVERWALVLALDHFGTFSNLNHFNSAEGNVPTYDFDGSSYTSSQVNFQPVEEYGNIYDSQTHYYNQLHSLNSLQSSLFTKYSQNYFPFICIGGCFFQIGHGPNLNPSTFSKYSFTEIQTQINSKTGLYSVINAESNTIITLINQVLATRNTTSQTTGVR